MTPTITTVEELTDANLSLTGRIEIFAGRKAVCRNDGTVFYLDQLSDDMYWIYMQWREQAWYTT